MRLNDEAPRQERRDERAGSNAGRPPKREAPRGERTQRAPRPERDNTRGKAAPAGAMADALARAFNKKT